MNATTRPEIQTTIENGLLTIDVIGHPVLTIDPANYPDEFRDYATLHGLKQRYIDAAALGKGATPAEKYEAISALVTHHRATGEWSRVGQGGTSGDGLLVQAIMAAYGLDRDTARKQVAGWDKKTQHALRESPELAPIIARLRVAKTRTPSADVATKAGEALAALRAMAPAGKE